ncbi:MAG: hypothetical protein HQL01_02315 [Nitrospirae bacterium]|nr:hypothetical protein [Nitrospirota bacterium]
MNKPEKLLNLLGSVALNKDMIEECLSLINSKLLLRNVIGDIHIFWGAAMLLLFNSRISTKDIDTIFSPVQIFREVIQEVEAELGLHKSWLNDAVKGFVSGYSNELLYRQYANLRIYIPHPEYLLAMKLLSARTDTEDIGDIRLLIKSLKLKSADDIYNILKKYYSSDKILIKTQYVIGDILKEMELNND